MNAAELARAMIDAKADIDAALEEYDRAIRADADADDLARRAKARSFVSCKEQAPKATVALLQAMVDLETSDAQKEARLAEGLKRSAGIAVDGKKQWLSALQSIGSLTRAEAELARWEPRETSAV